MNAVEPACEALEQSFHQLAEAVHAITVAAMDFGPIGVSGLPGLSKLLGHTGDK